MIMFMKLTVDYNPPPPPPPPDLLHDVRAANQPCGPDVALTGVLIILHNQNETLELRQSP